MPRSQSKLSTTSVAVLEMVASGRTYDQILAAYPDFTYVDIFRAAEEALELFSGETDPSSRAYTLAEKRERHPRAYEKWTDIEDAELRKLVRSGETVARIAGQLQRNRSAIRSRIMKLNLIADLTEEEKERFYRIVGSENARSSSNS